MRLKRHLGRNGLWMGICIAVLGVGPLRAQELEKPFRLKFDGGYVDTGGSWGHSGPCVADVDGDGVRDLLVGDFSGKFTLYKNVGTEAEPRYAEPVDLMAGGEVAKVPIY